MPDFPEIYYFVLAVGAVFLALCLFAGVGLILMIRDTIRRRGGWGLNFESVVCPRCATAMPRWRWPRSFRQAMWGGYTCPGCGRELDKWGREIDSQGPQTT